VRLHRLVAFGRFTAWARGCAGGGDSFTKSTDGAPFDARIGWAGLRKGRTMDADSLKLDMQFCQSPRMVGRPFLSEFLFVPLVGSTANLSSIYATNEVGALIWKCLDGVKNGHQIVAEITAAFEVEVEQARADYLIFVEQLLSVAAIEKR
jgi:hypothetical protein